MLVGFMYKWVISYAFDMVKSFLVVRKMQMLTMKSGCSLSGTLSDAL